MSASISPSNKGQVLLLIGVVHKIMVIVTVTIRVTVMVTMTMIMMVKATLAVMPAMRVIKKDTYTRLIKQAGKFRSCGSTRPEAGYVFKACYTR